MALGPAGAHPASYPMGFEGSFHSQGREADHSPPSSIEVKNGEVILSFSQRDASFIKRRENFTFTFLRLG
jgi:hypothetical protein